MDKKITILIMTILIFMFSFIIWLKPDENSSKNYSSEAIKDSIPINDEAHKPVNLGYADNSHLEKKISVKNSEGFVMPNAVWQNRTVDGITYIFGEGNPSEVALNPSDYTGDGKWENYVTPKSEKLLKQFLTDENLKNFVDKCGSKMGLEGENSLSGFSITDSKSLDINGLLYIDKQSKRKKFDEEKIDEISQILYYADNKLEGEPLINLCMNGRDIEGFKKLHKTFDEMTESYINQPKEGFYDQNDPKSPGYDIIQKTREALGIIN